MIFAALILSFGAVIAELLLNGNELIILIPYGLINPALLFVPRILKFLLQKYYTIAPSWLQKLEKLGLLLIAINIPGSLYFHRVGIQYDRFIHFTAGIIATQICFLLLLPFFIKKNLSKFQSLVLIFIIAMSGNFLWEMWQLTSDGIFGTKLFYDLNQSIQLDFKEDISFAAVGIVIALFYLNKNYQKLSGLINLKT